MSPVSKRSSVDSFAAVGCETPLKSERVFRFSRINIIMNLCLLDIFSIVLLMAFYLTKIDLVFLVNLIFVFIIIGLLFSTQRKFEGSIFIYFIFIYVVLSTFKLLLLTSAENYNFELEAAFKYYLSLLMPLASFMAVYSIDIQDVDEVTSALETFAKRYFRIVAPLIIVYFVAYMTGQIEYFGLGVNFHYITPFLIKGYYSAFLMLFFVLITGKRALLVNFVIQTSVYFSRYIQKKPLSTFFVASISVIAIVLMGDSISFLFVRFQLMQEVVQNIDLSTGLFEISNSWEALVLFGGRLEEIIGIFEYFKEHPNHIWFGSPPGANYVWSLEISDYIEFKNYAHLTWAGYLFRYGLVFCVCLAALFFYILARAANRSSPLWLVMIGILSSSMFGANLMVDPTAWIMIALTARFGPELAHRVG